ncbi:alpha/beta fold hydrolase [Dactylosporangium darangshiense]|uniref:Alpha/beta hydrolase n=1 Tax=Dactylosporangium darangshiense TaxID=579108 RepID=A0ABP8DJB9_9ACTN
MPDYTKGTVRSLDGTEIGYRHYGGKGPGVVLVHGGMKAAQHFARLARALADGFGVYVPDRRGRGMSGPHGADFAVQREVEDLRALLAATEARFVFGLSSGALVSLRTALSTPQVERLALYEPPLSVGGSTPMAWVPRYERELDTGNRAAALVTALKGLGTEPVFARVPRAVLTPVIALGLRVQGGARPDEASIAELVPTERYDMRIVAEMADTAPDYARLPARVLLLGGTRGPGFLARALDELERVLPHAERRTLPGLTHEGPEDDGRPLEVAGVLRDFYTAA